MNLIKNRINKGNILIVDDTPDNLRLLSAMLTAQGYEVRKSLSGKMALTACQMLLPDVVLLDINMPEMNGYEVCRQLKMGEKTRDVPVIFISALDDVLDKVKAFDVGGVDYITKPFNGTEVLLRIENQINLRWLQIKLQEKNLLLQKALDDLKAAQVQQIHNEKMLGLGKMVGGIAHEVNNPISFIYGNLDHTSKYVQNLVDLTTAYQEEYPRPTNKIQQIIQDIDLNFVINDLQKLIPAMYRGVDRIRSIVVALQKFSRHDQAPIKEVDIHEGIESTLVMLQHRLRETKNRPAIHIAKEYGRLPLATCYASELNQVFMHLLNNAIDALDQQANNAADRGNSNGQRPQFQPQISISTQSLPTNRIRILIADNGIGVDDDVRLRVFDPFFSTKGVGKSSGLGLSISHQIIVQKHKGMLNCTPFLEQGAEFAIEIPINQSN